MPAYEETVNVHPMEPDTGSGDSANDPLPVFTTVPFSVILHVTVASNVNSSRRIWFVGHSTDGSLAIHSTVVFLT